MALDSERCVMQSSGVNLQIGTLSHRSMSNISQEGQSEWLKPLYGTVLVLSFVILLFYVPGSKGFGLLGAILDAIIRVFPLAALVYVVWKIRLMDQKLERLSSQQNPQNQ